MKRRRVDEDARAELIRRTSGSSSALLAHERILDHGRVTSRELNSDELVARAAHTQRVFKIARSITIASDGSRLGRPAEETIVYAASIAGKSSEGLEQFGVWLPPQVLGSEMHPCPVCFPPSARPSHASPGGWNSVLSNTSFSKPGMPRGPPACGPCASCGSCGTPRPSFEIRFSQTAHLRTQFLKMCIIHAKSAPHFPHFTHLSHLSFFWPQAAHARRHARRQA
jgi:hypothetical protein